MKEKLNTQLGKLNNETWAIFSDVADFGEYLHKKGEGWSIIQVLNHLYEAESLSLGYMMKKMKAGSKMKKVGTLALLKRQLLLMALSSSFQWKAPSYIANPSNEDSLDELKRKWKELRDKLGTFVEEYPTELLNRGVYKHPIGGRMKLDGAIDSFIYHQRHHLHQIKRIKKELKK